MALKSLLTSPVRKMVGRCKQCTPIWRSCCMDAFRRHVLAVEMREHTVTEQNPQSGISAVALNLARGLFLGGLMVTPWMIGGVPYWAALITAVLFFIVSMLVGVASFFHRSGELISNLCLLLGILLVYPALQLLPISSSPLERLEHVIESKSIQSVDILSQTDQQRYPVSCSPYKTRQTLAAYAIGFAVFLFSGVLWNTRGRLRLLFLGLTINGVVLSLFGMIQRFRWNGAIYGIYQLEHGGQPFASFVNRNNASSYLLVCIAAGLGLMMSYRSKPGSQGYRSQSDHSGEHRLLIGISLILIATGIIASLSRGGILSALAGALAVLAMTFRNGRSALAASGIFVGLCSLAIWFGWGGDLLARFAVLRDINIGEIGRIQHWSNTLPALRDFGLLGSGFGTYSLVNRPYQSHENQGWYVNADNQYLEWALELGLIGFSLVIAVIVCLFFVTGKLLNSSRQLDGFRYSLGVSALFLLVSEMVHAIFDFGITRPATFLSISALFGAITAYYSRSQDRRVKEGLLASGTSLPLKWNPLLALGCFVIMAAVLAVTGSVYQDEKIAKQVTFSLREIPKTTPGQLGDLRKKLLAQIETHPESSLLFESLSQVDQALMRLEFLKTQGVSDPLKIGSYWNSSAPARLALTVLGQDSMTQTLHRLWSRENLKSTAQAYEDSLRENLRLNPLNGYAWRELGILNWMRMHDQNSVIKQLACAAMLRPAELDIQMIYAIELAKDGNVPISTWLLNNLMTRFPQESMRVWEAARRCYPVETAAEKILPGDIGIWIGIWDSLSVQENRQQELRQFAVTIRSRFQMNSTKQTTAPQMVLLALAKDFIGKHEDALRLIKSAVEQKPLKADWRRRYAEMLVRNGQVELARKQLESAHQISPSNRSIEAAYRKVLSLDSGQSKK